MNPAQARDALHEALTAHGFDRTAARDGEVLRYVGTIGIGGRDVSIAIEFPCLHFTVFPRVVVLDAAGQLPGVAAHLDDEDSVCYAAPGSIVLDSYNPAGTALLVLQQAAATLAAGASGEASADVRAEFAQHWGGLMFLNALPSDAPEGLARLVLVPRHGTVQAAVLSRDNAGLNVFPTAPNRLRDCAHRAAYLLRVACDLDLPGGKRPPGTLAALVSWAAELEAGLETRLLNAISHRRFFKKSPMVFLLARNGCVGAEIIMPPVLKMAVQRAAFQTKQLVRYSGSIGIRRWGGQRCDRNFMLNRNLGGEPSLVGRKVVLVGCGTIGSHLARFLVQGGAGQGHPGCLWLVDNDVLMPGNVGRHLLGPEHLLRSKAKALAGELGRQFPDTTICPIDGTIMDSLAVLTNADLIVDATGEEALSLAINDTLLPLRPKAPDALYAWLVGNGAAAQALFVSGKSEGGACRKCLHPVLSEAPYHDPVAADWELRSVPAACGESAFLPYGVAASAIAAGLASRMVMEWATGRVMHALRTLRVDQQATIEVQDHCPNPVASCPCCSRSVRAQSQVVAK